jgi:hypothetical protein
MVSKKYFMALAEDYIDAEIHLTNQVANGTMATQYEARKIATNLREMLLKGIAEAKDDLVINY